jgi:ankyrin repeat protein
VRSTTSIHIEAFLATLLTFVLIWTGVAYALPADDLYLAAGTGNIKEVRKLLNQGVNPNAAVDTSGITALMQAARTGDTDIVKLLLNKGANINARAGQMGITALMNAAAFGDVEMVRLLIDKGADINAKDTEGLTALSQAKVAKKEDIVDLLKTHGAKEKSEGQSSFNNPIVDKQIVDPQGK